MKKTFLLFLLLICTLRIISQDTKTTILTFTANSPGDIYHPFTSINITNVTRGWTETLVYPDTVLVLMNVTTTVDELELYDNYLDVSPNPFSGQTNATFQMDAAGWAHVKVYGVNGTVVASHEGWFEKGPHRLSITLEKPQMAILSVTTPNGNLVAKLIQTEHCGYNKIEVCNVENRSGISKEAKEIGDFIRGDVMSYEAVLEDGYRISSDTITQVQYGDEIITLNFPSPIGTVNGLFSVSASKQVWFSRGNLQYKASTNTWRFAANQYDYIGEGNSNVSSDYNDYIDLFGWGTSGWDNGNTYYQPWDSDNSTTAPALFGPPCNCDLSGPYVNADWGVFNPISNGGNQEGLWRTLFIAEWSYLLFTRNTLSGIRFAFANVKNINGLILLPDDWNADYFSLNYTNASGASFNANTITNYQWSILEQHGAVFLPAAGIRYGISVVQTTTHGYYCSKDNASSSTEWILYFGGGPGLNTNSTNGRNSGQSVRLVRDLQ